MKNSSAWTQVSGAGELNQKISDVCPHVLDNGVVSHSRSSKLIQSLFVI